MDQVIYRDYIVNRRFFLFTVVWPRGDQLGTVLCPFSPLLEMAGVGDELRGLIGLTSCATYVIRSEALIPKELQRRQLSSPTS